MVPVLNWAKKEDQECRPESADMTRYAIMAARGVNVDQTVNFKR